MTGTDAEVARMLGERGDQPAPLFAMSTRELQVVALVGEGLPDGLIAAQLDISPLTVKSHLRRAMARTGQSGRCALLAWCFRLGALRWAGEHILVVGLVDQGSTA